MLHRINEQPGKPKNQIFIEAAGIALSAMSFFTAPALAGTTETGSVTDNGDSPARVEAVDTDNEAEANGPTCRFTTAGNALLLNCFEGDPIEDTPQRTSPSDEGDGKEDNN